MNILSFGKKKMDCKRNHHSLMNKSNSLCHDEAKNCSAAGHKLKLVRSILQETILTSGQNTKLEEFQVDQ